jgi:hypothetical protein
MGQYGNQPDFGTEAAVVTPIADAAIPTTTKLGGACLYVGVAGDVKVILSSVSGAKNTVTAISLISGGTGYITGTGATTVTSAVPEPTGSGLTIAFVAAAGVVTSGTVAAAGSNYRVGDIVTIALGSNNATFRIDATQTLEPTATDAITFKAVPAGSILPVIVDYVLATGTTATDMIALK